MSLEQCLCSFNNTIISFISPLMINVFPSLKQGIILGYKAIQIHVDVYDKKYGESKRF